MIVKSEYLYVSTCLVNGIRKRFEEVSSLGVVAPLQEDENVVEKKSDETRAAVHVPLQLAFVDELAVSDVEVLVGREEGRSRRVRVELARVHAQLYLHAALLVLALGDGLIDVERNVTAGSRASSQADAVDAVLGCGGRVIQAFGKLVKEQTVFDETLHLRGYEVLQVQLAANLIVLGSLLARAIKITMKILCIPQCNR